MAQKSRPTRRPKGAPKAPGDEDNGRTGQAIPPRHPKGTPKKPGDEDLVIFTPDHRFYWVSRDDYRKPEHEFLPDPSDLYDNLLRTSGDVDVDHFAPFSHDAQSGPLVPPPPPPPIPEPATLVLLATGLAISARSIRRRPDSRK